VRCRRCPSMHVCPRNVLEWEVAIGHVLASTEQCPCKFSRSETLWFARSCILWRRNPYISDVWDFGHVKKRKFEESIDTQCSSDTGTYIVWIVVGESLKRIWRCLVLLGAIMSSAATTPIFIHLAFFQKYSNRRIEPQTPCWTFLKRL